MPESLNKIKSAFEWLEHGYFIVQLISGIAVGKVIKALSMGYTHIPEIWWSPIEWSAAAVTIGGLVYFGNKLRFRGLDQKEASKTQITVAAALAPPPNRIDLDKVIADSYNSDLFPEIEASFMTAVIAKGAVGQGREALLIRFSAAVLVNAIYEIAFANIYRSQILLLQALTKGALSLAAARAFYDNAASYFPDQYKNYSFEQWLTWLQNQVLIVNQGLNIVITPRGKDFLKFLVHTGRSADDRRL